MYPNSDPPFCMPENARRETADHKAALSHQDLTHEEFEALRSVAATIEQAIEPSTHAWRSHGFNGEFSVFKGRCRKAPQNLTKISSGKSTILEQNKGSGEMPSSRLDSHRNSRQFGMVERFTAFIGTAPDEA